MKITLTAKLKLRHSPEQKIALDAVTLAYRDALNYTSGIAFANNKLSAGMRLQTLVYEDLRAKFGLPSQMACNAPRQVATSYKVQWTKLRQDHADLASGRIRCLAHETNDEQVQQKQGRPWRADTGLIRIPFIPCRNRESADSSTPRPEPVFLLLASLGFPGVFNTFQSESVLYGLRLIRTERPPVEQGMLRDEIGLGFQPGTPFTECFLEFSK
ncbi:hypothetical protein ACFP9V_25405 [Deinococcus radiopugnans]|uniref:Transposase n=1 Tax=Deinococcus radiopugnans ATCC 19172 TaxID=585398 RepID=A0A5C4XLU5_9DEIO|nr:hypothetical protein [Deinococcus radiopugnans]MBB6018814.1 putative transposase [Deinococcus radiopugnans ATCC 19172]TNM64287.1 hypothetical protein FHR04_19830 [Deinococcus radiopugnans ATCC 19172]